jgi:hypothetical protein
MVSSVTLVLPGHCGKKQRTKRSNNNRSGIR